MSRASNWERVRQLFHEALAQPPHARDAFVAAASSGDSSETRAEVRALLAAHDAAGAFLESPLVQLSDEPPAAQPTLRQGDRVGHFEVTGTLGAGGMGEVYRGRDLELGRDVALKILPPAMAADPRRLARFERESRLLAALDHPNIATIHSIEHADGLHVLVLQLVEGPTLADRMKQGPVSLSEALGIAGQLARALEAAHASDIVHRDLKPANVKVAEDGHVTLLDFGLAKERIAGPVAGDDTIEGVILGTWGYMSPEQARGLPADRQSDIWSFGCILYELLTARPAFARESPSKSMAAVLEREPDWTKLPAAVPARLRVLLRRLLEKDRANRLHDIADARLELDDLLDGPESHTRGISWSGGWTRRLPAVAGIALLLVTAVATVWWTRVRSAAPRDAPLTRFTWTLPAGLVLESAPALSPDGRKVAFAASKAGAPPELYVRELGELDARTVSGTQGAQQPFWSPDSASIGFFASGNVMRVALDSGAPVAIAPTPGEPKGGAWGRDGTIVFAPAQIENALWRVPAGGGTPEPATVLAMTDGDNSHRWPAFLPDGIHFIYFVRSRVAERRGVYLARIDRPASPGTMLFRSESEAVFDPLDDRNGLLLTAAAEGIDVRRLDLRRMTPGDPRRLSIAAAVNTPHDAGMVSVGAGVLMHASVAMPFGVRVASISLSGDGRQIEATRQITNWPRLSPDGTRLATARVDAQTGTGDIWVDDLVRGTRTRVTHERIAARLPVWSPDGSQIAYSSGFSKPLLVTTPSDGTGGSRPIPCPGDRCEPTDWSPDGRWLVGQVSKNGQPDVWLLPLDSAAQPRPLLTESYTERDARISPDGTLLAYVSEESGRPEVSVRSLEGTPRRIVIAPGGASQPVWLRDGRTLAFVDPDGGLQLIPIRRQTDGRIVVGALSRPAVPPIGAGHWFTQYDVTSDRRVYFVDREPAAGPTEIGFVLGWHALLDRGARQ